MTSDFRTSMRTVCACIASLVASAAMAQSGSTAAAAPSATASLIVVLDASTGQFRAATAAESTALLATPEGAARSKDAASRNLPKAHSNGGRGVRLSDEFMSHAVAFVGPDGRLLQACFHTREDLGVAHPGMPQLTNQMPKE